MNINDDILYYLAKDLATSQLVVKNCNQFIQRVALKYDLSFLATSLEEENWTEEEFYLILSSLKILGEMEDFVEVFSLSKEDIDNTFLQSFQSLAY